MFGAACPNNSATMSRAPLVFNTALLLPTNPADQDATPPSASCFDSPRSQHPPLPIGSPACHSGNVVATRPLGANSSFAADARSPRSPRIVSPRTAEEAINFDCTQIRWFLRSDFCCALLTSCEAVFFLQSPFTTPKPSLQKSTMRCTHRLQKSMRCRNCSLNKGYVCSGKRPDFLITSVMF